MSSMTGAGLVKLRQITRRLGLNRLVGSVIGLAGYEARLGNAMATAIRPNDVVWDVGANVGYYTTKFAELVGTDGRVFAFEPSPQNGMKLKNAVGSLANVTILDLALSDRDGEALLAQGNDDLGATSRLAATAANGQPVHTVALRSADSLIATSVTKSPNVMKIDVEGHELSVLAGMRELLPSRALRDIFMEVHFALLEEMDRPEGPSEISALLNKNGFSQRWLSPSHLHAFR